MPVHFGQISLTFATRRQLRSPPHSLWKVTDGKWGLIRANFGSIRMQPKLEAAMAAGDAHRVSDLISQSIITILKAGLTARQKRNLDVLKANHREEMQQLMTDAFQRGWVRDGTSNLSNAMDEVLLAVAERIRAGRAAGECN